ncbi:hypothetical protein Pla123a_46440 [Posidoniimonas polymericola]|uniref:Lipoprotein n=1 Tax=Posidoniimonas polymericola TaxID=2528002 RepID=A0A5C5XTX7_9BACT|nr:hypothetical protein [Posidoniimonas polymericola]TWT66756.1 hypothetical protein Pla123a_46440 [Posidoniimonas polymericola]
MRKQPLSLAAACLLGVATAGCGPQATTTPNPGDAHAEHVHPTEGPHHGALAELGEEEYHAEIVHDDDAGKLYVYLLDGAAKQAVSIDAEEITVNLSHDGKPEQFKLVADPEEGDATGGASRFSSSDAELLEEIEHDHADGQLVVSINGSQFRGALPHHDHDDHDHDH